MRYKTYWLCFGAVSVSILLIVGIFESHRLAGKPARPAFPAFGRVFVSDYSGAGSVAAHDIYYNGLFDFGHRIQNSDILLVGSSHVEFGLSAARMSARFSDEGRPARVFNLGVGCGESVQFGLDVLAHNKVRNQSVIVDALSIYWPISQCGVQAEAHDKVQAYLAVFKIWTKFAYDWALDPILPRLELTPSSVAVNRFLRGFLVEQDWATGDIVFGWHAAGDVIFPKTLYPHFGTTEVEIASASHAIGIDWHLPDGEFVLAEPILQQASALGLDLAVTLVPWVPYQPGYADIYNTLANLVVPGATPNSRCFAAIAADGLITWDSGLHLQAAAREIATNRLVDGLDARHCFAHTTGEAQNPPGE